MTTYEVQYRSSFGDLNKVIFQARDMRDLENVFEQSLVSAEVFAPAEDYHESPRFVAGGVEMTGYKAADPNDMPF